MAANINPKGKSAAKGPELASRLRSALLGALDLVAEEGKTVAQMLAEKLAEDPFKFMEIAAKYVPRQIEAEVAYTLKASDLTDDELADIAATRRKRTSKPENRAQKLH